MIKINYKTEKKIVQTIIETTVPESVTIPLEDASFLYYLAGHTRAHTVFQDGMKKQYTEDEIGRNLCRLFTQLTPCRLKGAAL